MQSLLFSSGSSTGAQKARKLFIFRIEPEVRMELREEQEKKEDREWQEERERQEERDNQQKVRKDRGIYWRSFEEAD